MKKHFSSYIFFLLCGIFFLSCNRELSSESKQKQSEWLKEIFKLSLKDGIAAKAKLDSAGMPHDTYLQAIWRMDYATAIEQQNISQSDTLFQPAYEYLILHGSTDERFHAEKLMGSIFSTRCEYDKAMQYYLKAQELAEAEQNFKNRCQIYHLLGGTYIYTGIITEAAREYKRCLQIAEEHDVTTWLGPANVCMGRLYTMAQPMDSLFNYWEEGVKYYQKGMEYSKAQNQKWEHIAGVTELAVLYMRHNHPLKAMELLQPVLEEYKLLQPEFTKPLYLTLMNINLQLNRPDSAMNYIQLLKKDGTDSVLRDIYMELYNYYVRNRQFEKAAFYNDSLWQYSEKVHKKNLAGQVAKALGRYEQQKVINEKNRIKIERDTAVRNGLIAVLLLLIVIVILSFSFQRRLHNKKKIISESTIHLHKNEKQIRRNKQFIKELQEQLSDKQESHEQIEEQRKALATLQQMNKALSTDNLRLQQHIDSYKNFPKKQTLDTLKENAERVRQLEERERQLMKELVNNDELTRSLREKPKFLEETEWKKLRLVTDKVYNCFTERLIGQFPQLTEVDMQLCILVKLRFTISQIAILTAVSPTTVSIQKQRLKKRILQTDENLLAEGQTVDMWIWEY